MSCIEFMHEKQSLDLSIIIRNDRMGSTVDFVPNHQLRFEY